jgi:acetylornithine deacetylase/succinyl-diaminopimelate desuccinylase-like protein
MLDRSVKDYLQAHRERFLESLFELLGFESLAQTNGPDGCRPCAEWIAAYIRRLGLTAEIVPTRGQPCVIGEYRTNRKCPTLLVYTHYDVQSPDPLDLWTSAPFRPEVRNGFLYARGASDDKGQLFAHLMAIEAYLQTSQTLPLNLKLLVEGEEEIGSPNMEAFLTENKTRLAADALVVSDVGFFAENCPSIIYALRGMCPFEVTFVGPNRDVHSGLEGGVVVNPLHALADLVAAFHDDDGRVTVPGFYDDVLPLRDEERKAWAKLPYDKAEHARRLGVEVLAGGEKDYSPLERNWARPTLECNGMIGGYTGPGVKTVIPSRASAKFSMRLVADQDPGKIFPAVERFVCNHTPPGIRSQVTVQAVSRPVWTSTDSTVMRAAQAAMTEAFGAEPALIRCGASVPVTEVFQRLLGLDTVVLGISLPEDNLHSPNECLKLTQLWRGAEMMAALYHNLAEMPCGTP